MTQSPSDGTHDQERTHTEDPAEGATSGQTEAADIPREHSEDPAEGADDESATS